MGPKLTKPSNATSHQRRKSGSGYVASGNYPTPSTSGLVRRPQFRDLYHWDRMVQDEDDDVYEERWEGFVWLVWYRGRFQDDFLFPPAVTNLTDAREEFGLLVSHQQAAQVFREEFVVWRIIRDRTTDQLFGVAEFLMKSSGYVDLVNLGGSVTCLVGGILSLVGFLLAPVSVGASLGLTAAGTAVAIAGALTSTGAVIGDYAVSALQNKEVRAIMESDRRASQHFKGALDRLGVTSDRLTIWEQEHPQSVSPRTREVVDGIRAMCGVFYTIQKVKTFSVAKKESLGGLKALFRVGRVVWNPGEIAMSTGVVMSLANDAFWAPGHEGIVEFIGYGGQAIYIEEVDLIRNVLGLSGLAIGIDALMIGYLCYRIHNGSESERAEDIRSKVSLLEREKRALCEVYQRCEAFL